jgi:hypothetical protein
MKLLPVVTLFYLLGFISSLHSMHTLELEMGKEHHVRLNKVNAGELMIVTLDVDPYVIFKAADPSKLHASDYMLAFEHFCPDGIDSLEIFYNSDTETQWSPSRSALGGAIPKSENWQPFAVNLREATRGDWTPNDSHIRLDFGQKADRQIAIRNVVLRQATPEEAEGAEAAEARRIEKIRIGEKITAQLTVPDKTAKVEEVTVTDDTIEIEGDVKVSNAQFRLLEFEPHENAWQAGTGRLLTDIQLDSHFKVSVPRFIDGRDRLANSWAIAEVSPDGSSKKISHAVWASDTSHAALRSMPRLRPSNHKGLGGIVYKKEIFDQDLNDLGITAATVNFKISRLFAPTASAPIVFNHQGRDWHFNTEQVKQWDDIIRRLTDRNMVISGILLIDKEPSSPLLHPDYNQAGMFSIANLSTREGADAYRVVVAFLAERYSRPDKTYGWVSHWILFNEVDYGWAWTNMGEQPMAVYMDTYQKALRLSWLEASIYNPTVEVFISLTHNWDYQPKDPLRYYPPRALLDRLALYSQQTGDFHWGVAMHPYPQSLLKPRTWEDSEATPSFDTRYITIKNIEVLDAYLHQKDFLYKGKPRTVLLSEQGYHTPDYSIKSMQDKAAAIAYTWHKIRPLETIETYHYHRWVDHPDEGGLKVGLRTLPSAGKPNGERKEPAFSVLSALETDEEASVTEPLKATLGITDWQEVRTPLNNLQSESSNR